MSAITNAANPLELLEAASAGDLDKIDSLLRSGCDVNTQHAMNKWTALHWASKRDHVRTVEYLLSRGADASLVTDQGKEASALAGPRVREFLASRGIELKEPTPAQPTNTLVPNYLRNPQFFYAASPRQVIENDPRLQQAIESTKENQRALARHKEEKPARAKGKERKERAQETDKEEHSASESEVDAAPSLSDLRKMCRRMSKLGRNLERRLDGYTKGVEASHQAELDKVQRDSAERLRLERESHEKAFTQQERQDKQQPSAFSVHVRFMEKQKTFIAVEGATTLRQVIDNLPPIGNVDKSTLQLFADATCKEMLIQSQSIGSIHAALHAAKGSAGAEITFFLGMSAGW